MAESLLWHPRVHHHFGEELTYFLFRFNRYSPTTCSELSHWLINSQHLTGFCLYVTLGVYDALLRVWLNRPAREQLLAGFKAEKFAEITGGATVTSFESRREHHYPFVAKGLTNEDIDRALGDYTPEECGEAQANRDSDLTQRMVKCGLCEVDDPWPEGKEKFYVAVSEPPPAYAFRREGIARTIAHFLFDGSKPVKAGVDKISLYEGVGFASFLVKGVASNLGPIIQLSTDLRAMVSDNEMYTFTILLAPPTQECDDINPRSLRGEGGVEPSVAYWIPELYSQDLDEKTKMEISHFVVQNNRFRGLDPDDRKVIRRLIVAKIAPDKSPATEAIVFSDVLSAWFRDLEYWVRKALPRIANLHPAEFEDLKLETTLRGKRFDTLPLGDMLHGLVALLHLEQDLPQATITSLVRLRNDVQHNDLTYVEDWQSTIVQVADALPRLRKIGDALQAVGVAV